VALTLFGYGTTTKAIAKRYKNCNIFDDNIESPQIDEWGNHLFPSHLFDPNASSCEITSPGISPSHPLIQSAKNLISEYDFFSSSMPFSIWISGTNGKTTTTDMCQWLLTKRGSVAGGNIGTPLAELDANASIWVLETSSFAIHYTKIAKPNLYILLPVNDDHASWHGDFKKYEEAKLKPLASLEEGEVAIVPKKYQDHPTDGYLIGYENSNDLAKKLDIDISKVTHKEPFLLDALLALATTKILFDECDYDHINAYKIGAHRIEELTDKSGRLWVNDSKGTNVDATLQAIKRYKNKKMHLILGGDDKGANLAELFAFLQSCDVEIYAIGSNTQKIVDFCSQSNLKAITCQELQVALEKINKLHTKNSVALLSPAASSLDQFSSYAQRGDQFKDFIKSLS
jgi:UDP-N-acetylmuramoylalanine--D-glutamate ligase